MRMLIALALWPSTRPSPRPPRRCRRRRPPSLKPAPASLEHSRRADPAPAARWHVAAHPGGGDRNARHAPTRREHARPGRVRAGVRGQLGQPPGGASGRGYQQPRPGDPAQQQHRLARGGRGRAAVPDHAQPNTLGRFPADHPDPARHLRRRHTPHHTGPFYHFGKVYYYISYRQPVELGHQTTHRYAIARAALNQQNWNVLQGELTTLVQTYRFFQTAAYRREKLRLANELADFNDHLLLELKRGLEINRAAPADVTLAEVENQATRQQVEAAMQDYANALTDLRNQMGVPESAATAEPLGEFILPGNIPAVEDQALIQIALQNRPDLFAARAACDGAAAAVRLAKGDRIPTPIVGPLYQSDEVGVQYFGFVYITPLPFLNNGKPLVIQREAEYCRMLGRSRRPSSGPSPRSGPPPPSGTPPTA